jgi:hypothetical protein
MIDFIKVIIVVLLMAFIGFSFLGLAIVMIYRDVLGFEGKVTEWLDRQVGTGWGRGKRREGGFLARIGYAGLAVASAVVAYLIFGSLIEEIALYFFGR